MAEHWLLSWISYPRSAIKVPGSQVPLCLGSCGNEVSLSTSAISQMVIKCDEGFDG